MRLNEVNNDARRLVDVLLKSGEYWRSRCFEPPQDLLDRNVYLVRCELEAEEKERFEEGVDSPELWNLSISTLHKAAIQGRSSAIVKLILMGRSPIDAKDCIGRTALHLAAMKGHMDAIIKLISLGCDIGVTDRKGRTALHLAAMNGHTEIMYMLKDVGCDIRIEDHEGRTALHFAAMNGEIESKKMLESLQHLKGNRSCNKRKRS